MRVQRPLPLAQDGGAEQINAENAKMQEDTKEERKAKKDREKNETCLSVYRTISFCTPTRPDASNLTK